VTGNILTSDKGKEQSPVQRSGVRVWRSGFGIRSPKSSTGTSLRAVTLDP